MKKYVVIGIIGIFVKLYTTFILQQLWNWFVTPVFEIGPVSFWGIFGLVLVVSMFERTPSDFTQREYTKFLATMMEACVPDDKRDDVNEKLDELKERVWIEAIPEGVGNFASITVTLILGWGVHTFLL